MISLLLPSMSMTQSDILPWQHPEIVRVDCRYSAGTAFRVSSKILLTATHVISGESCEIGGEPVHIIGQQGDLAVLSSANSGPWMPSDCGGYVKGRKYDAIGYAHALDTQTEVDVEATGVTRSGQQVLDGVFTFIPGQSGGPVLDHETGRVVGIVNTFNPEEGTSGSIALKSTSLCKASA